MTTSSSISLTHGPLQPIRCPHQTSSNAASGKMCLIHWYVLRCVLHKKRRDEVCDQPVHRYGHATGDMMPWVQGLFHSLCSVPLEETIPMGERWWNVQETSAQNSRPAIKAISRVWWCWCTSRISFNHILERLTLAWDAFYTSAWYCYDPPYETAPRNWMILLDIQGLTLSGLPAVGWCAPCLRHCARQS